MDDQPGIVLAFQNGGNNLVEGHHFGLNVGRKELERQHCGSQRARDGDLQLLHFVQRVAFGRDDHRAVAIAYAAAARHQRIAVLQVRIRVEGDRGHVEVGFANRPVVQRLNVAKHMGELETRNANLVGRQTVEHECVVRIRTVCNLDFYRFRTDGAHRPFFRGQWPPMRVRMRCRPGETARRKSVRATPVLRIAVPSAADQRSAIKLPGCSPALPPPDSVPVPAATSNATGRGQTPQLPLR